MDGYYSTLNQGYNFSYSDALADNHAAYYDTADLLSNAYLDFNQDIYGGGPKWDKFKEGFKRVWTKTKDIGKKIWEKLPEILKISKKIIDGVKEGTNNLEDGKIKDTLKTITDVGDKVLDYTEKGKDFYDKNIKPHIGKGFKEKHLKQSEDAANKIVKAAIKQAKYKKYKKQKKALKKAIKNQIGSELKLKKKEAKRSLKGKLPKALAIADEKAVKGNGISNKYPITVKRQLESAFDPSIIRYQNQQDPQVLTNAVKEQQSRKNSSLTGYQQLMNLKNLK